MARTIHFGFTSLMMQMLSFVESNPVGCAGFPVQVLLARIADIAHVLYFALQTRLPVEYVRYSSMQRWEALRFQNKGSGTEAKTVMP